VLYMMKSLRGGSFFSWKVLGGKSNMREAEGKEVEIYAPLGRLRGLKSWERHRKSSEAWFKGTSPEKTVIDYGS